MAACLEALKADAEPGHTAYDGMRTSAAVAAGELPVKWGGVFGKNGRAKNGQAKALGANTDASPSVSMPSVSSAQRSG